MDKLIDIIKKIIQNKKIGGFVCLNYWRIIKKNLVNKIKNLLALVNLIVVI